MKKQQAREGEQSPAVSENVGQGAEAQPAASAPEPKDILLSVMSVSEFGFCRIGRRFERKPTLLHPSELKPGDLAKLEKEHRAKNLIVKVVEAS